MTAEESSGRTGEVCDSFEGGGEEVVDTREVDGVSASAMDDSKSYTGLLKVVVVDVVGGAG
jgi:hypothetical protein